MVLPFLPRKALENFYTPSVLIKSIVLPHGSRLGFQALSTLTAKVAGDGGTPTEDAVKEVIEDDDGGPRCQGVRQGGVLTLRWGRLRQFDGRVCVCVFAGRDSRALDA